MRSPDNSTNAVQAVLSTVIPALCDKYDGTDAAADTPEWFVQQAAGNLRSAAKLLQDSLVDLEREQR